MLYLAPVHEPWRHRGLVIHLETSPFAPSGTAVRDVRRGAITGAQFAARYLRDLHGLWEHHPGAFYDLLAMARGSIDVTLADDWPDGPHAPRRVLATALRQIVWAERERQRREGRRRRAQRDRAFASPEVE